MDRPFCRPFIIAFSLILVVSTPGGKSFAFSHAHKKAIVQLDEVLSESNPIVDATDRDDMKTVSVWVHSGHSPYARINNSLREKLIDRAAMKGSKRVFSFLLQEIHGIDPNAKLIDFRGTPLLVGLTALTIPGDKRTPVYENMINELLQAFPQTVNEKDHAYIGDGRTALHQAAANGDTIILKALIAHGASVNVKNSTGETPLHLAARFGRIDAIKYLISAGAKVNEKTIYTKATPLMAAAEMGQEPAIRLLMASGANKMEKDTFGKTAPQRYREYATDFYSKMNAPKSKNH